jgi:hypothetical protein
VAVSPEPAHREAARALLESIRLREPELERHLDCALSPAYWRALVPELSIGADPSHRRTAERPSRLEPGDRDRLLTGFSVEGLLQTPPLIDALDTARMRSAVVALTRADWPPVFSWIYDEFWRVPRAPALTDLFTAILGEGYWQTAHVWTHVVAGRRGSSGWRPHVDYAGSDTRLTVWIALSDATIDSGCMCVIPRHLVPAGVAGRWYDLTAFDKRDVMDLLHASRPLPVPAGAVLAWDAGLMHWGSARQTSGEPRISYSMELAPGTADASMSGPTLAGGGSSLPSHEERLAIIAKAVLLYQPSEPRAVRYAELCDRLLQRLGRV